MAQQMLVHSRNKAHDTTGSCSCRVQVKVVTAHKEICSISA